MTHHLDIYVDRNWKTIGTDDPRHPRYGQPQENEPFGASKLLRRIECLLYQKAPEKPQDEPETTLD